MEDQMYIPALPNKEDEKLINLIVKRAIKEKIAKKRDEFDRVLDMCAAHEKFTLRLKELLDADIFNFHHDFGGIVFNLNRTTGDFGFFIPRFSGKEYKV
jgi:hypothetical protein